MYFWDEEKPKLVKKCPGCSATFIRGCSTTCPAQKLENKHQRVVTKMIAYCLPKTSVTSKFPQCLSAELLFSNGWGWTEDIVAVINLPQWTLRSKKEFFDTVSHELGHITAYKKTFTFLERKILKGFARCHDRWKDALTDLIKQEFKQVLDKYYKEHWVIIDKYLDWEGHDYSPWYQEYLRLHKKLVNSPFKEYAYGNTKPRQYGFNQKGQGEYKPKKLKNKN